jgi:hypothetical protein
LTLIRYHHLYKTHFLDGKRNRRIDHALYALVKDMISHYEDRHARQSVGLEGPDLLGQRRREILARVENITRDSIQDFGDSAQFHIASLSRPGEYHVVDLHQRSCDCEDFPRILFCRHIAAIYVHFPHLNLDGKSGTLTPASEYVQQAAPSQHIPRGRESLQLLSQEIFSLSQRLTSESAPNPAVLEAFRSAKYSLTAAIASVEGNSALPEKDVLAPNQRSWPETAKRMGAKKVPRPRCLPNERGLTERSIGVVKGKRKRLHNDPYAGGERSGKRAKSDALSQAANARARTLPDAPGTNPATCPPHVPSPSAFSPNVPTFANGPHY